MFFSSSNSKLALLSFTDSNLPWREIRGLPAFYSFRQFQICCCFYDYFYLSSFPANPKAPHNWEHFSVYRGIISYLLVFGMQSQGINIYFKKWWCSNLKVIMLTMVSYLEMLPNVYQMLICFIAYQLYKIQISLTKTKLILNV